MPIPVTVDSFVRAETDLMFSRLAAPSGTGVWTHYRSLSPLDQQPIIRQNRDTLYSSAIIDLSHPVRLTVPDAGDRYLSVMVVNRDHYIPLIIHEAGEYVLSTDEIGTDYALLAARILIDPADERDAAVVNRLQDGLQLEAHTGTFHLPDYDPESHDRVRTALLDLAATVPDFGGAFGKAGEVDPIRHLLGSAAGWGGLPEHEAIYLNVVPNLPVGEYALRLQDVPVDAFWSVSLYNADGYFEENKLGVYNINSVSAVRDEDGAVTVRFGVDPQGEPNYLSIMEGWNYLIRLYRPRQAALSGVWTVPQVTRVR